ncbi:hypothetical protein BDW74DRAFT_142752 [Aspergillus multicolor]|uniref:uncharacterized protein n=1 Tax=Aspergillus multicolor TaxID=41759 RepID=UPI003CCE3A87
MFFSQLYLEARALREGSMIPPRRRRTRWRVDSYIVERRYRQPPILHPSRIAAISSMPYIPPLPSGTKQLHAPCS